jgi:hypothetical protein
MSYRYHVYVNNDNHVARWISSGNWSSSNKYLYEKDLLESFKGYIVYFKNDKPTTVKCYGRNKGKLEITNVKVDDFFFTKSAKEHLKHINNCKYIISDCVKCKDAQVEHLDNMYDFYSKRGVKS